MFPLSTDFDPAVLINHPKSRVQYVVDLKYLNPALVEFLSQRDVYISWAVIFLTYAVNIPHSDSEFPIDYVRLNWQFSEGEDTVMNWYVPKDGIKPRNLTNPVGRKHYLYDYDTLDLVHSESIGFPSIVQVTIPHDVTVNTIPRYCLSTLLHYKSTNKLIPMSDACKTFKDFIREQRTPSEYLNPGASERI